MSDDNGDENRRKFKDAAYGLAAGLGWAFAVVGAAGLTWPELHAPTFTSSMYLLAGSVLSLFALYAYHFNPRRLEA